MADGQVFRWVDQTVNVRRQSTSEWKSRPFLSFGLRAFVFVTPVVAGLWVVAELASAWSRPVQIPELVAWWALITLAGLGTLFLVERATRQLLPLAALLRLSLLFPDHAPDRFAVARRAARPKQVMRQLEDLGDDGTSVEVRAAQKVLELSVALSVHDRATRGHSERVQVLTDMISRELHLPEPDRARLRWAALLHDIGKLKVPSRILNKPAKPDAREWTILRRHPTEGARIAAPVLPWLGVWGEAVAQHHEWYDGTGYPVGLRGSEIAKGARIVAVADVFEVITAPRPYRRPVSVVKAREELVRVSATQLDPQVVRAFLNVSVGELWPVVGLGAILCQVPLVSQAFGILGRALPGISGSTAATGAAGAMLFVGIGHPADIRIPAPAQPSTSQPSRSAQPAEPTQPDQLTAAPKVSVKVSAPPAPGRVALGARPPLSPPVGAMVRPPDLAPPLTVPGTPPPPAGAVDRPPNLVPPMPMPGAAPRPTRVLAPLPRHGPTRQHLGAPPPPGAPPGNR